MLCVYMAGCSIPPDYCPNDLNKVEPGLCGCGYEEHPTTDITGKEVCDYCYNHEEAKGVASCDCQSPEVQNDRDGDGVLDCMDDCPDNPDKKESGVCGCSTPDDDRDGDGEADCHDACPDNPAIQTKAEKDAATCGCEIVCDPCPAGSVSPERGPCGCHIEAITSGEDQNTNDQDNDGVLDCVDICPNNPAITDSLINVEDLASYLDSTEYQSIVNRCDIFDADGDGLPDDTDPCPTIPNAGDTTESCETTNASEVGMYGDQTITIRHALDFAELRRTIASNPDASYTILFDSSDKAINMGYPYLDVSDKDGSGIQISDDGSCAIHFAPIDLTNVTVNGNHHTITASYQGKRCTLEQPLFGNVDKSSIADLTLSFDVLGEGRGILANEMTGNSHIENIQIVDASISSDNEQAVGGIVGAITGDDTPPSESFIDAANCSTSHISVKAPNAAATGGLFGSVEKAIIQPAESVDITAVEGKDNVGGIVGKAATPTPTNSVKHKFQIVPLAENGTIRATVGAVSGNENVGGFIGYFKNVTGNSLTLANIITKVTSVKGKKNVGGFAGRIGAYYMNLNDISHTVDSVEGNGTQTGGFAGSINGFMVSINAIKNTVGSVSNEGNDATYTGGFAGKVSSSKKYDIRIIQNTVNTVKGYDYVSGLFGSFNSSDDIYIDGQNNVVESECGAIQIIQSNVQTVEAVSAFAAGLIAYLDLSNTGYFRLWNVSSIANVLGDDKNNASTCTSEINCSNIGGLIADILTNPSSDPAPVVFLRNVVSSAYLFAGSLTADDRIHRPMITGSWGKVSTGADSIAMYTPYESDSENRNMDGPYYNYSIGFNQGSQNEIRLRPSGVKEYIENANDTDSVKNDNSFSWIVTEFTFGTESAPSKLPGLSFKTLPQD